MVLEVTISYEREADRPLIDEGWVAQQMQNIWEAIGEGSAEVGIRFVSDETIQAMNKTYRSLDEPTDILSFAAEDDEHFSPLDLDELPYIGDLAISLATLQRNAQSFRVETNEELLRLLIHGTLHLLGHDHASNEATEPMLTRQEALLAQLRRRKG